MMLSNAADMVRTEEARAGLPSLSPFLISVRQREAWATREPLVNHAQQHVLFFSFPFGWPFFSEMLFDVWYFLA